MQLRWEVVQAPARDCNGQELLRDSSVFGGVVAEMLHVGGVVPPMLHDDCVRVVYACSCCECVQAVGVDKLVAVPGVEEECGPGRASLGDAGPELRPLVLKHLVQDKVEAACRDVERD